MPTFQELLDLAGADDFTPDTDEFTSLGSAHTGELEALTSAQEKILALGCEKCRVGWSRNPSRGRF